MSDVVQSFVAATPRIPPRFQAADHLTYIFPTLDFL